MATSLKINSLDEQQNTKTTNINYINETCADATLAEFATNIFEHSANTLQTIIKVTSTDITNAESDTEPTGLQITFSALPEMPSSTNWNTADVFYRMEGKVKSKSNSTFIQTLDWTFDDDAVNVEYVEHYKGTSIDEDRTETCVINVFDFLGLNGSPEAIVIPCTIRESGYPDEESTVLEEQGDIYEDLADDLTVIGMTWEQIINYVKTGKILKVYAAIANYVITEFRTRHIDEDDVKTEIDFNVSYDETNNAFVMTAVNDEVQLIKMEMILAWIFAADAVYSTVLDKYAESVQDNITYDDSTDYLILQKSLT